ncbi:hypothetical protein Sjap_011958 [Stephania japonica]|uniref:Uncharacterized protein n=1 Tax=Stephania japonica TaxID=461633 RepID=A0AAP0P8I9_9MAGN
MARLDDKWVIFSRSFSPTWTLGLGANWSYIDLVDRVVRQTRVWMVSMKGEHVS